MNRKDLEEHIAETVNLTKADATRVIDAILDKLVSALKKAEPIVLNKLGTFTVKERLARVGRNPKTGEKISINASKIVAFKASKALKDAVKDKV